MPRYRARWHYRAGSVEIAEGAIVELDAETAAHINRDSPGVLEEASEARDLAAPPADRMVQSPSRRRDRQADPSDQGPISRETFKAVKA